MKRAATMLLAGLLWLAQSAKAQEPAVYRIDQEQSRIELRVLREGLLKFLAHDHLIVATRFTGEVRLAEPAEASSVVLIVEADSLRVLDPGVSEKDRNEVQATMLGERVLDTGNYPEIRFIATGVHVERGADGIETRLDGTLSLHGVERPLSVPVRLWREGDRLRASGEATVRQTDHDITPIRMGGGTVRVRDPVEIRFQIVAVR